MPRLTIRELGTDAEVQAAFPLLCTLRERLRAETFLEEVRAQERGGYRLIGGFDDAGRLAVLAGIRVSATLARGPHLFVDDLVTAADARGEGLGREMMRWIAARARAEGLPRVYLDSRATARGFYEKLGFTFLTAIPCWIAAGDFPG